MPVGGGDLAGQDHLHASEQRVGDLGFPAHARILQDQHASLRLLGGDQRARFHDQPLDIAVVPNHRPAARDRLLGDDVFHHLPQRRHVVLGDALVISLPHRLDVVLGTRALALGPPACGGACHGALPRSIGTVGSRLIQTRKLVYNETISRLKGPEHQVFTLPPSTASVCPVTKSLSADARKTSAPRRSCGCSSRLIERDCTARSRAVFTWPGLSLTTVSIKMKPGASVLTRMPCSPSSRASARVNAIIPPLLVP